MSLISGSSVTGAGGAAAQYEIERSLRFNSADSAYLNRTPASAGNRKTWTYSFWIKRSKLTRVMLLGVYTSASDTAVIEIESDQINWYDYLSAFRYELRTTQVLRDPSAWYHIMCVLDTTQATSSNRNKIYINGSLVTALTTATYPTQNLDGKFNTATQHSIGTEGSNVRLTFDGYQTEINFIDGQALTPSDFGEYNSDTGVWQPIEYTGTYGTNGFYLNFSDNSSTTTLGDDFSGNNNNWTPNNFSVTAGAGNDSLVDTPTPYGTDTGAGGEVRGNYNTWNPLIPAGVTLTNGNLDVTTSTTHGNPRGTISVSSGKWYWEITPTSIATNSLLVGIANINTAPTGFAPTGIYGYFSFNGNKYENGSTNSSYGNTFTNNDVIGVALDLDNNYLYFSKNGTFQNSGVPTSGGSGTGGISIIANTYSCWCDDGSNSGTSTFVSNFGQRPFAYTAPSGFKALCTQNLPEPTIVDGGEYFNTVLYTGTGSSQSITGVGFQPDWVWIKERSGAADHGLYDVARGVQKQLESNTLDAETTETTGLTAFNTDGFTVGALAQLNTNNDTYVAWNWVNGGASTNNTAGSITSTVRVNTTAGFSIVSYTGSSASTVGHGLSVAPSMIIAKQKNNSEHWVIYHVSTGKDAVLLFTTSAAISSSNYWGSGGVTASVFGTGGAGAGNAVNDIIAYCFAPVAGYSAFGSYTGNGNANGPFVFTGFRPAFVVVKVTNTTGSWDMYDAARNPYNVVDKYLNSNNANAEGTFSSMDFLSNGFKLRNTDATENGSGNTIIYMAFAENPFKYSLAR